MNGDTKGRRRVRLFARAVVAVVSAVVLAVSALAWVQLRTLDRSTPTAQLIAAPVAATAEQNILLVGVDSRTDAMGNPLPPELLRALNAGGSSDGGDTADTLIVVHVPAGGGRATAISIPRDSYVQIAGGFGKHKINSAYSRGVQSATEALTEPTTASGSTGSLPFAPESLRMGADPNDPAIRRAALAAGARTTIGTVEQLTGLRITHFASVNLAGFADVSEAIGGVPVCLRAPVDDPYSGALFPGGPQQISGVAALAFVRQRHGLPDGDLDRIARQQVFLAGATDRLLSAGMLADPFALGRLSGVVSRSVTLDAGWDLLGFARQMQGLSAGAVTFRTIPTGSTELSTPYDGTAVKVDPAQVRMFVAGAIAGDNGLAGPATPNPSDAAVSRAAQAAPPTPTTTAPTSSDPSSTESEDGESTGASATTTTPPVSPTPPITAAAPGCIN